MKTYLGIDFGTSGARATLIDDQGEVRFQTTHALTGEQSAPQWRTVLYELITRIPFALRRSIQAISVDGTSGTMLPCDRDGGALSPPLMYNDGRAVREAEAIAAIAPSGHPASAASSGLAKLLWWVGQSPATPGKYFLHQADWLAFQLHGKPGVTDYHNALKSGGDPEQLGYPDWMAALPGIGLLPRILEPGETVGTITPRMAQYFTLPPDCVVRAGTTDSIAAFIATGARQPGEAVTSLGSTLVLKLLSLVRVDHSPSGIYSHRFGDNWLVGGASNSGGAVLRSFFDDAQLASLSAKIDVSHSSGLDYYPLNAPGERFPLNDPIYPPLLSPRPDSDVQFLHGLLEGIARIERDGYALIQSLGATPLTEVDSAGGGARNSTFTAIRAGLMGVPMKMATHAEAAYGAALLARDGTRLLYSHHESA